MQQTNWQAALRKSKIDPATLLKDIGLTQNAPALANKAAISFPLRVTEGFKNRITNGDASDPLLRQILPLSEEDLDHPDFSAARWLFNVKTWRNGIVASGRWIAAANNP